LVWNVKYLKESPKFLLEQKNIKQFEKVMDKIKKFNANNLEEEDKSDDSDEDINS